MERMAYNTIKQQVKTKKKSRQGGKPDSVPLAGSIIYLVRSTRNSNEAGRFSFPI